MLLRFGIDDLSFFARPEPLPILMPLYKWWELPYLYVGAKCYDLLAGSMSLAPSRLLNRRKTEEEFPLLKLDGLVGSVMYAGLLGKECEELLAERGLGEQREKTIGLRLLMMTQLLRRTNE